MLEMTDIVNVLQSLKGSEWWQVLSRRLHSAWRLSCKSHYLWTLEGRKNHWSISHQQHSSSCQRN
jgi:hypothetical protein